ncbi:sigma-70 family RNA polymerase sigma factor [Egicoccus sp. AB-alg6-2]|uniref:sigma-70 family RNA polymerase sigma factor n=1 Tax=Egicoccus sp. AB-alg6-2 TaxID=3242692 RepID=UPI00359CF73E
MATDEGEFRDFVDREYAALVRALSLYCGGREVAEELAQDAFARAYQRWNKVSQMQRPGAWVRTVAFNLARSGFRRKGAERRAYARHGAAPTATQSAEQAEAMAVRDAVLELPDRQRQVLIHRYFLGDSVAETADTVGISDNAVKSATFKAIENLRRRLGDVTAIEEGSHHA